MRPGDKGLRHLIGLLMLVLPVACAPQARRDVPALQDGPTAARVCRVGPDDGPPVAGGTAGDARTVRQAERGIGGTGLSSDATLQAERGIGGTGIVAVITGFASVCLGGREVMLDDDTVVSMDGAAASTPALRAGQLAIVEATGAGTELRARRVQVRHEVSGPVEGLDAGNMLRVAGQQVAVTADTLGERSPAAGWWVRVSGLRRPDGSVLATRVDRMEPGPVTVHGPLRQVGRTLRIGTLTLRPETAAIPGHAVIASGRYIDGVLHADTLAPDLLVTDPAAYFRPDTRHVLFETYVTGLGGTLEFGAGTRVAASPGLGIGWPQRAIVQLDRHEDGSLRATRLHESGAGSGDGKNPAVSAGDNHRPRSQRGQAAPGNHPGRPSDAAVARFEPAPVPNRMPSLDGSSGSLGERQGRQGTLPGERQGERAASGPGFGSFAADPLVGAPGSPGAASGGRMRSNLP
ncbi:conserved protein of unknown function [Rhodovastum atsumiense]|uniref:DUF5666 domain-containing protein n=1 Tax=Rhodovastum atsumiense TaxID=504468 RepID=A0A5M6IW60_9PROT|nr:DUF5666 domain-containing protein [Rhodovastum atsumiense]KAA5612564.1 hypothetical protein F1189_08900 [Rhodovastum atsumiense]CAH2601350.1 conserved protein of unknown function [Rhodovastum atsumiense]